MAKPWERKVSNEDQTITNPQSDIGYIEGLVNANLSDLSSLNYASKQREIYDKIRNHEYADQEELNYLKQEFENYIDLEEQERLKQQEYQNALRKKGDVGTALSYATSLGGSIRGASIQAADTAKGYAADVLKNGVGNLKTEIPVWYNVGKNIARPGGQPAGVLGGLGAVATLMASKAGSLTRTGNVVGSVRSAEDESKMEAWDAFREVIERGGSLEQAEQARDNAYLKNLAITGPGSMVSAYIGNRMISGAKGALSNPAVSRALGDKGNNAINSFSKIFNRISKYDPIEAASTKVAKITGVSAAGTATGAILSAGLNTGEEEIQEHSQNLINYNEVERALGNTGEGTDYNINNLLQQMNSEKGLETTYSTLGTTMLMNLIGLPLSARGYVKGGYGNQKANTFGQHAIRQMREGNINPNDDSTYDKQQYNVFKQMVGNWQQKTADETEELDFQDVATGYSAYRAAQIRNANPALSERQAIEIANNEFIGGISKNKSHYNGPTELSDAYKKFTEQTGTQNNYKDILVDPTLRQQQENVIEKQETSQPTPSDAVKTPITGNFKEGSFDKRTAAQAKQDNGGKPLGSPSVDSQQNIGVQTQPTANTGLEIISEQEPVSHKVSELLNGTKYQVTSDRVSTGLGDNYRYNTVEVTNTETGKKELIEQKDDNTFVVDDGSGYPVPMTEVDLRKHFSTSGTINMSAEEQIESQSHEYKSRVAEEIYRGMDREENLVRSSGDFWKWVHTGDNMAKAGLTSRDVDEIAIMLGRADLSDTSLYFNLDKENGDENAVFGINLNRETIRANKEFENVGNRMKTNAIIMLWKGADATTVLHELSHGGWRSLSEQQRLNYTEMSLQTSKEFMCKILGLDPQISDQEFVDVYYALVANPKLAKQMFLEKGILPDSVMANYSIAFKQAEQRLLGIPEAAFRASLKEEIQLCAEERYANEFTMWYFGGYLVGSKPKNFFQVMADAFCRRIADVLHACNYTAEFVNSPSWKNLKAKMPDLVSQMTLYENMTLGQSMTKETAQPVPGPTFVEKPVQKPVQQEQSTVQQPVVETQLVAEPVTQPTPKPVEVKKQIQPEPGPNITPDKIIEEIKKKPEVVESPPVETKQEEVVQKEESKEEQPKEESKKEVTVEVPEEVAQQIEEEGVPSQQEILEQIKKSTTGMVDRDKDRRYVVDGKTYSVEVDEDTHTPVVYLHVANRKEEVRPNSLIDMAILIKRRLDEASNKEEHNTIIKEAQRAKERAEDYLKTDGDKITIRLKNNAEYNSLREKRNEIDKQIKEETDPKEKSKLQEYRKFIQGELTRVGREEQEALDYDKSVVENTNKAIVMLGKIEVQNGKQPQQTQPVQKPSEVKKNEQPKTTEVKKEQNVEKELDKQDNAIVTSIKKEKGKEIKETKQKKKETKPEPTDEEKTQSHVEKLKGYKNNTVRKAQINNKKNGWLTDPNKRKAIDILVKENPKEYLAMLPDELLDEYKDVVDKQLYEDIKNERELKNDKNAFFAKQRIRKKVMGDKYRANKEDTWEKYNKNADFKKEVEEEVEKLYQEELKNGKKTKEQLIEERSKDEDFIKKVKDDVLAKINSDEEMAVLKSCYDGILDDNAKDSFLRDMAIQKIKEGYVPEGYKKKQIKNNEVYGMFTDQGSSESRDISWVDNIIDEHLEPDMDSETANYLSNRVWFSNAGDLKLHTDAERKEYSNYLWNQCKEVIDQNKFKEFNQNVENIFRKEVNSYVLEGKLTVEEGEKIIAACKKYVEDQNKKKDNTNVVNKPEIKEETKEEAKEYNEQLQMTLYKYLKDSINKFDRKLITTKEAEEVFKILRKRANNKDFVKLEDFRDATNHYQAYEFCFELVKKYSAGSTNSKKIGGFIKLPQTILKNKEQIKKIILHKDGLMGAVILNNGSLGSFFYTPRESKGKLDLKDLPKNSLESLILLSISNGAVKTECLTKELSTELQKNGFQVVSSGYTSKGTKVYQLVKQQGRITDAIERVEKKQITPIDIVWEKGKIVNEAEMPLIKVKNSKGEEVIVSTLDDSRLFRDSYMIDETFGYDGWKRAERRVSEQKKEIQKHFSSLKTDKEKRDYLQEQVEIYRRNALKYGRELNYALYRTLERNEDKVYGEDRPGQMNRDQRQTIIDQRAKEWGFVDKNGRVNGVRFWEEYNKRKEDIANLEDRIKNAKKYELTPEEVKDLANQLRARKFYWNWEEAYKILTTRKNMQKLTDWRIAWNKGDKTKYINENALRYFEQQLQENTIQQKSGEKFYYYAKMELFIRAAMPNLKKRGELENRSKIGNSYNSIWYSNVGLLNSDFEVIKRKLKDAGLDTVKWFGENRKIEDVNHVILKQIVMKDFMNIMKSKAITDKFGKYTEKEIKGFFNQKQLHTRFNLLEASKKGLFPTVLDDVNDILREKYGGLFIGIDGRIRLFASDKNSKVRSPFLCKDRAFKNDIDAVNKFKELQKKKGGQIYLRDILDHPELYEIYPGLEDSPVYLLEDGSAFGQANPQLPWKAAGFNPDGTVNEFGAIEISFENINHAINNNDVYKGLDFNTLLHSIIIHEIQHLIQGKEYFAQGNNTIINEREREAMMNERYKDYLGINGLWKFGKDFFGVTPRDLGLGSPISELGDVVAKTRLTAEILDEMIKGYEFDVQQQYNIDEFEENYGVNFNKIHKEIEDMKISKYPKDRISFFRDLLRYNKNGSFHGYKTELAKLIFNAEQYFGDGDRLEGFMQNFFYQAYSNPDFSDSEYGGSKEGWRNYKESVGEQESKFQERKVQGLADDNAPIKYGGYKYLENPYDINKKGYRGVDGLVVDRMEDGLDHISENLEHAMQPHVWYSNTGNLNFDMSWTEEIEKIRAERLKNYKYAHPENYRGAQNAFTAGPSTHDERDFSYIGSGEGSRVWGWGGYLSRNWVAEMGYLYMSQQNAYYKQREEEGSTKKNITITLPIKINNKEHEINIKYQAIQDRFGLGLGLDADYFFKEDLELDRLMSSNNFNEEEKNLILHDIPNIINRYLFEEVKYLRGTEDKDLENYSFNIIRKLKEEQKHLKNIVDEETKKQNDWLKRFEDFNNKGKGYYTKLKPKDENALKYIIDKFNLNSQYGSTILGLNTDGDTAVLGEIYDSLFDDLRYQLSGDEDIFKDDIMEYIEELENPVEFINLLLKCSLKRIMNIPYKNPNLNEHLQDHTMTWDLNVDLTFQDAFEKMYDKYKNGRSDTEYAEPDFIKEVIEEIKEKINNEDASKILDFYKELNDFYFVGSIMDMFGNSNNMLGRIEDFVGTCTNFDGFSFKNIKEIEDSINKIMHDETNMSPTNGGILLHGNDFSFNDGDFGMILSSIGSFIEDCYKPFIGMVDEDSKNVLVDGILKIQENTLNISNLINEYKELDKDINRWDPEDIIEEFKDEIDGLEKLINIPILSEKNMNIKIESASPKKEKPKERYEYDSNTARISRVIDIPSNDVLLQNYFKTPSKSFNEGTDNSYYKETEELSDQPEKVQKSLKQTLSFIYTGNPLSKLKDFKVYRYTIVIEDNILDTYDYKKEEVNINEEIEKIKNKEWDVDDFYKNTINDITKQLQELKLNKTKSGKRGQNKSKLKQKMLNARTKFDASYDPFTFYAYEKNGVIYYVQDEDYFGKARFLSEEWFNQELYGSGFNMYTKIEQLLYDKIGYRERQQRVKVRGERYLVNRVKSSTIITVNGEEVPFFGNNHLIMKPLNEKNNQHTIVGNKEVAPLDETTSRLLNKFGIEGLHYFGHLDRECFVLYNDKSYGTEKRYKSVIVKGKRKFIDDLPSKFKTGFSSLYKNENELYGPPSIKKIDKVLEDFSKLNNIDSDEVINKIEQLYNIKHITNSDFFNSDIQKKIEDEFPNLVDMLGPGAAKEIIARKYGIAVDNSGNIWSGVRTYDNAGSMARDFDTKAIERFMKGSHDILKDPYGGYKRMYISDHLVDINIEKENILTDDRTEGFVVGFDKFNDVVDDKNKSQIHGRLNKKNRMENKVVSEDFEDFQKDVLDGFSSKLANSRQRATYTGPVVKNKDGIYTAYVNMKNPLILTITEFNKNWDGTISIETERNGKSGLFNDFDFWRNIYSEYDSNKNDGIIFVTKDNDIILSLIPLGENKIKTIDNFGTYDSSQSHVLFSNSGNRNFHGMNYNDYHNYVDKYKDVYRVTFTKSARTFAKRQKEMEYFRTRHQEWKEIKDGENVTFERIMPYQEYKRTITYNGVNDVDNKEHLITPKERTKTQKVLDSVNEYYQNTVTGMFNDLNPIYRLCKDVGALHAYEKMVVYRNQGNLAYDVISSGFKYYDPNTGKIERSTSLESIVATIGTDEVNEIDALGKETGNKMNQQWRFIMYGYAKRAIELDNRGIKQPISKNEALAIVDYIENCNDVMIDRRGNKSTVANVYKEELANFIEYNNRLLHVLVEGGLHSEEEYRRMLNANRWYIPLQKDFSEEEGDLTPISSYIHHSPSYVNLKSPLKLIKGSEYKKIKNPLEVAMERTIHFFELKAKNEVALTLIDEVIGQVTYTASNKKVLLNANIIHRIAPHKFTKGGKPVYKVSDVDQTFYVMRNGQKEVYQVTDKQLFLTLRNMDQEQLRFLNKWFIKPFTMPAKIIRATATATYDFGLGNVIRDTMTAWSTSENGFIPLYDSLWGMYQYVMDTQWAREYLMNNGEFTTRLAEEDINNVITVKEKQKLGQVLDRIIHPRSKIDCMRAVYTLFKDKGIMNILSKLQAFNTMMELGTRIAEYKNARMGYEQDFIGEKRFFNGGLTDADITKATGDIIHASKVAKDITINFGQHGRWAFAKIINRFIPFFNALLQGIYKQLNTMGYATTFLTGNLKHLAMGGPQLSQAEQTRGKYALMKLGLLAIAGILKAYEGAGDPDYDDAQDWEKEANWVFASGWKWPKDQEFGRLIGGTFEKAAYRYINGEEVGISDILVDALSCFSPDSYIPAILSLSMIFYGPGYNSFTKQQIVPEYMAKKNEVGYKQVDMYTSNMAADLSYFLYKVLHVDVSAKKLDAALQNQLSNTNKYIKGFYDVAREVATGQKNPPIVPRGAQEGDWNLKDTFRKNTPAVVNTAIQPIADRFNTRRNTPQQVLDFQKYYKEWSKYASTDKLTKEEERAWNIVQKANEKDANERKKKKELRKQFMAGKINEEKFLQQNQKIDEARKKIAKFVKQKTKNIDLPFIISF